MACKDCKKRQKLEDQLFYISQELNLAYHKLRRGEGGPIPDRYLAPEVIERLSSEVQGMLDEIRKTRTEPSHYPTPESKQVADDFEPLHFGVSRDLIDS